MRRARSEEAEATDRLGRADATSAANDAETSAAARRPKPRSRPGAAPLATRLWAAPTRRHFLGLVLAAGAISVGGEALRSSEEPRHTWNGRTRWIGHC